MKIKFDACVYKTQLIDHDKIKNRLLNFIDETPYQGLTENKQIPGQIGNKSSLNWDCHISRCDWDYGNNWNRPWFKLFRPNFDLSVKKLLSESHYDAPLDLHYTWFQQYKSKDSHGWHIHGCQFTGVYYLEFPRGSSRTEIVSPFSNKKKKINVKEGDIIVFPSTWIHRAPHNKDKRKTIISFNFNIDMEKKSKESNECGISYFE